MTHKPTNPWARKTGLITVSNVSTAIPYSPGKIDQYTELISGKLWQSIEPTDAIMLEVRPTHIINCCWFADAELPDMKRLSSTADAITTLIKSGERILIHCLAGRNRSSLLSCLVLMRLNDDWTGAQAVNYLESKRHGVLTNMVFRKYLASLGSITPYENEGTF